MITQHQLKNLFNYNNGNLIWKIGQNAGQIAGYNRPPQMYRYIGIEGKYYLAHRLIYLFHYGTLPKYIDHIDNDVYNNKIENLRVCTPTQNSLNAKKSKLNTSGYKGISFYQSMNKWCAKTSIDNKVHRKFFDNKEDANIWLVNIRETYHKQFANHG